MEILVTSSRDFIAKNPSSINKTRILILGSTGMLGNTVTKYFCSLNDYDVVTTRRNKVGSFNGNTIIFDALKDSIEKIPANFDYVLNCVGIIKPFIAEDPVAAIKINSLFPWQVAEWCNAHDQRLIHITTDCVYSGHKGKYVETDSHDALDAYGKSKSLGECASGAMVLRTSIIGEEIHKNVSLLAWAKSQKGGTVDGYATHLWNGITTNKYAEICDVIIKSEFYEEGLFHIFAQNDVSKLQMLHFFNERFELNLSIKETTPEKIDRTLRTKKTLCSKLGIPTVQEMIKGMA